MRRGERRTGRLWAAVALLFSTSAVTIAISAPPASAAPTGTVVFIKDDNVWIMPAENPAAARPLTVDGTPSNAYAIPAADAYGTIYAVTAGGTGSIVRFDHFGNPVGAPFRPEGAWELIDSLRPSPDGTILAYTTVQVTDPNNGGPLFTPVFASSFTWADGSPADGIDAVLPGGYPIWYSDDSVVYHPQTFDDESITDGFETYRMGAPETGDWFASCTDADPFPPACRLLTGMDLAPTMERLAAVENPFGSDSIVWVDTLPGPPPAAPVPECSYSPGAGRVFVNTAWSPDGDSLMWDNFSTLDPVTDPGIYVASGFDTGTCEAAFASAQLVVADAWQPFWSPAPFEGGGVGGGATSDYVSLSPERMLDTRPESPNGYAGPKPGPGGVVQLDVTGRGASNVPDDAEAVVLNLTGVDPTADGYVTVWPCGEPRPLAANLNLTPGSISPNLVIAKVGAGGSVCIFTQSGAHLVADLAGYFPAGSVYAPSTPERMLDTRPESPNGYAGPKPGPGGVVQLDVTGRGASNVPDDAEAVVLNLTGVEPTADGYVTVWPCGEPRPLAANLNLTPGSISPNLVIAKVGAAGSVCIFTQSGTHLVADLAGHFPAGSNYVPLTPERMLDTRPESPNGYAGLKPGPGSVVQLDVTGRGASNVPDSAVAVVLNLTGVEPTADGFVTVWPCGQARPTAANLNLTPGTISPNLVIAKVGSNGRVCIFTQSGTHLVADLAGYIPAEA